MATATSSTPNGPFAPAPAPLAFPPTTHSAPRLPVLVSTALALQLITDTLTIDLRSAAAVLLRDPFATLELFRRATEECGEIFHRVEDCLASLPVELWPGVHQPAGAPAGWAGNHCLAQSELASFAAHARLIAERCRELAEAQCLDGEQAYLAGLLHEAEQVPELLGWADSTARRCELRPPEQADEVGFSGWLPPFLQPGPVPEAAPAAEPATAPAPSAWHTLLRTAHNGERAALGRDHASLRVAPVLA